MLRVRPVVVATVATAVLAGCAAALAAPSVASPSVASHGSRPRPAPVRDVATYVAGNTISMDWKNPRRKFGRVVVRYRKGATAPTPSGGSAVHLGDRHARSATLRHLAADSSYSVAIWTKTGRKTSAGRTATFTTDDTDHGNGTYVGTVTDTAGAPLAHAAITLLDEFGGDEFTATTGQSGRAMRVLPAGTWLAVVNGSSATGGNSDTTGYVGNTEIVRVRAGHKVTPAAVHLHPGAELTGRVTDRSAQPLAGVDVYATAPSPYALQDSGNDGGLAIAFSDDLSLPVAVSAADGSYRLRGLPPGAAQLCVDPTRREVTGGSGDSAGYLAQCRSETVDLVAGGHTSLPDSQLRTGPSGTLAGRIRLPSGKGARGVLVLALKNDGAGGEVRTGADGRYKFAGLEPGRYHVCFVPSKLTATSRTGLRNSCAAKPLLVTASATTTANRTLHEGGAITGTVTGPSGQPLAQIGVYTRSGAYAVTDSRGHYTLGGLAPRAYRICFDTSSWVLRKGTTGPRPGCLTRKISTKTGRIRTGGDIALKRGGAVAGVIRYADGTPVRHAIVDLEPLRFAGSFDGETMTDKSGHYAIGGAPSGRFQLCVSLFDASGNYRMPCLKPVPVTIGKLTSNVDETLPPSGTIAVTARDASSHPVAGVDVVVLRACRSAGGAECDHVAAFGAQRSVRVAATGMTSRDGTVSYPLLKPGTYAVCMLAFYGTTTAGPPSTGFADGCTSSSFDVTVSGGATTAVTHTLQAAGAITGRVTDSAGHGIRGAVVHVSGSAADDFSPLFPFGLPNDPLGFSKTAADGTYTVRSVTPGEQTVCVDASTAKGGASKAGYLDQCIGGAPGVTTGGTPVSISSDSTTTAPDVALSSAAGISGKITSTGKVGFAEVVVFDASGSVIGDRGVRGGHYQLLHLPPGTDRVCVENNNDARCYVNAPWTTQKPPANAKPIVTTAGAVSTGIDVKLHG